MVGDWDKRRYEPAVRVLARGSCRAQRGPGAGHPVVGGCGGVPLRIDPGGKPIAQCGVRPACAIQVDRLLHSHPRLRLEIIPGVSH
jgi:hypothetical protein